MEANPLDSANSISKISSWWLNDLLKKGFNQTLYTQDLYSVCLEDESGVLGNNLEKSWAEEVRRAKYRQQNPSILRTLFRLYGLQYILTTSILLIEEGSKVVQPILLGYLITYFTPTPSISKTDAYLYAMGVSLCAIIQAVLYQPYVFVLNRLGMKVRVGCCSLIYRKCLKLSHIGLSKTNTGQIVNIMSNDVNKIDLMFRGGHDSCMQRLCFQCVALLPFLIVGPLQAIAVLVLLWNQIGKPMLAGVVVLAVLVVVQVFMSKLLSKFRLRTAMFTDKRVTVMNEIISGMRIIKLYCWEKSFKDLVAGLRRSELNFITKTSYLSAILETIARNGRYFCIYATVLFYVLSGTKFRASELYVIVGLLNALSMHALLFVALAIKQAVQTKVTFNRITDFLKLEELGLEEDEKYLGGAVPSNANCDMSSAKQPILKTEDVIPNIPEDSDCLAIKIVNATASWDKTPERLTLHNISATVNTGQLVAVIGSVGSGKSSLLSAIIKELPLMGGKIKHMGRLAYISQQPWVFSATVKENIVFGNEFDRSKYDKILKACALDKDMALLPNGDITIIGDRGIKLSGGQRSRISLARALYMDKDIYLLDDPFSAVDTKVAKHMFENVLKGLLNKKTTLLVTHSLQFLCAADNIIILNQGEVFASGTYDELRQAGIDFTSLMKRKENSENNPFYIEQDSHSLYKEKIMQLRRKSIKPRADSIKSNGSGEKSKENQDDEEEKEETYAIGTVNWRVYFKYLRSGTGVITGLFLMFLCVGAQAISIGSDWWLSRWSSQNEAMLVKTENESLRNNSDGEVSSHFQVSVYSGFLAGIILFGLLRAFLFFKVAVKAGEMLHNSMFISIIRSPISFFDTNAVGRILNRFSKDLGQVDEVLPLTLFDFLQCVLIIVGIVCMTGVVSPWIFIAIAPLVVLLILIRHYYLKTSRQLQRLEGVTRSPVFSHLNATLQGLHTIRAFESQEKVITEFDTYQDVHSSAWFLFISTVRWLTFRLDLICALFVTAVSFASVGAAERMDAGFVGFSMTYAFAVMGLFQWTVRQSTTVENQMVSVERILEYCKLPSESNFDTAEKCELPHNWPDDGEIVINDAFLKYFDDSPYILKRLNLTISAREKIGVVGRTGAGKSSLITLLMRLVEFNGTVQIDGVNIQHIGLYELRSRISVIPQDPVLFTGTLRRNLDPFGEHDGSVIWNVLEVVEMKQTIETLPLGLDTEVSEGGINFSVGQRQLLCLARVMLRNNNILIIDEATANVDTRTDQLIQRTIRERFEQCTVLTIAHRLYTVMDSDKLMVLEEGELKEFDHPFILMQKSDGYFYNLVKQMDHINIHELLQLAKAAYHRKYYPKPVSDKNVTVTENQENCHLITRL